MEKFKKLINDKAFLKYLLYTIYIVITVGLIFSLLSQSYIRNFFATIENKTFDVRQSLLAPYKKVNKDIVIISVDEESYEYLFGKYGEWPISRGIYADLITYLEKQKPSAIAFDLMFVKSLKSSINEDNKLAKNIAKYDNVFTSINFDNQSFDLRKPIDLPNGLKAKVDNKSNINFKNEYLEFTNCRAIISQILNSTSNIGHINIIRENDGIARDLPPFVIYKNDYYPHLALKVALKYLEKEEGYKQSDYKINKSGELIIGNRKMPLTLNGTAILNRKNGTFQVTHGTEQKFYDSSSLQPETPKILNHGDENFQVANRTEQKFYNSSSLQPETPKIESKIKNKPQSPNKSFYDSNGDEIIVDKNGTGILNRGDGIFQVTHGGTQKTYNSFDEFSKDLNSLVENYIKNPKKTKAEYRQLVKLVHPDNYAAKGITPEEEKVLNDLFTRLNKAA